ncbi:MAG: hypothetical protein J6D26_00580 [Clostridia bacterium]|nr:hypothetical protein [Clostridia bacterium]
MKVKKILALTLAMVMVMSLICISVNASGSVISPSSDGYFWLEETDIYYKNSTGNSDGFVKTVSGESYGLSGNSMLGCNTAVDPGEDGYYIEFKIDVKVAGDYTLWLRGTKTGHNQASPAKIYIDGNLLSDEAYGADGWVGSTFVYGWRKATATLELGERTIKYLIDSKAATTSKYQAMFDCMCIIPSEYTWEPSITEKPSAPDGDGFTDGYAWLEEDDVVVNAWTGYKHLDYSGDKGGAFSDKAFLLNQSAAPGSDGYYLDFRVKIPETGTYTIWLHATKSEHSNASNAKILVDGAEKDTTPYGGDVWMGSTYVYGWRSVTLDLEEGNRNIRYLINDTNSSSKYTGVFDCMCIMPSYYVWEPSLTTRPVAPETDYIVSSFAITKADDSAIDALSEGLAIKASAKITAAEGGTVKIILAHYRADKSIVDFSIEPCTLTAEIPGDALAEYTVTDYEAGDFVKAFIWSDFETLVPITASISK